MNQRGFTFTEILIVLGVLLLFSTFFVVVINPIHRIQEARDDTREAHLNTILLGIEQKLSREGDWNCASLPTDRFREIGTGPGMYDLYSCLTPNYLSKYLVDPKEGNPSSGRDVTDGLVGHWKFDEGSGTIAYDASGNGNDGTLVDGPNWVDGKIGGALEFDDSGDYVEVAHNSVLDGSSFSEITLSVWIKENEVVSGHPRIISKGNYNSYHLRLSLSGTGDRVASACFSRPEDTYCNSSGSKSTVDGSRIVPLGEWTHIVATWDGILAKIYLNGEFDNSKSHPGESLKSGVDNLLIRNIYDYDGQIDDVRIYNRALSPEEIQDLYNYEYSSKYAIWQNPVTKNISLKSLESETKEVSTGAPEVALDFDGSGDYVDIGDKEAFHLNEAGTIGAWVNIPSIWTGTLYPNLISKGAAAGWDTAGWALYNFKDNRLGVGMRNESTVFACHYVNTIKDQWLYVVGTWNGSNVLVYSNGIIKQSCDQTINPQVNSYKLRIAHDDRPENPQFFPGQISDVRIYDRALSAEEVEQLYKGYDIRNGLVGHWPLNEGQGTTAYDRSGNGNDGILLPAIDGPTWTTK